MGNEIDKDGIDRMQEMNMHTQNCPLCSNALMAAHSKEASTRRALPVCPEGKRLAFRWLEWARAHGDNAAQDILDKLREAGKHRNG